MRVSARSEDGGGAAAVVVETLRVEGREKRKGEERREEGKGDIARKT